MRKKAMHTDAKGDSLKPANGSPAWTKIRSTSGSTARKISIRNATSTRTPRECARPANGSFLPLCLSSP